MDILSIFEWNTKIDLIEIFNGLLIALFTSFITVYLTNVFNKKKARRNIINKLNFSLDDLLEFRENVFKILDEEYKKVYGKSVLFEIRNQTYITRFEKGELALNKEKIHILINILIYRELNEFSSTKDIKKVFNSKEHFKSFNGKSKKNVELNQKESELIKKFLDSYTYFQNNKIGNNFKISDELLVSLKNYLDLLENLINDSYIFNEDELDILYKLKGYIKRNKVFKDNNFEVTWDFFNFILIITYINRIYLDEISKNKFY